MLLLSQTTHSPAAAGNGAIGAVMGRDCRSQRVSVDRPLHILRHAQESAAAADQLGDRANLPVLKGRPARLFSVERCPGNPFKRAGGGAVDDRLVRHDPLDDLIAVVNAPAVGIGLAGDQARADARHR